MLARSKEDLYAIVRNNKQILLWARSALWLFLSLLAGHVRVNTLHFPGLFPSLSPPKACLAPLATTTGLGAGSGRTRGAGQTFQAVQKVGSPKTVSHQQQFVNSIRGASARPNREKQISSQSKTYIFYLHSPHCVDVPWLVCRYKISAHAPDQAEKKADTSFDG